MARKERVHECFKVWSPPLSEGVTDVPIGVPSVRGNAIGRLWGEALIQSVLEATDLLGRGREVVSGAGTSELATAETIPDDELRKYRK